MINFRIIRKSKKSKARIGALETGHGVIETPCLVPVATRAAVKTLSSEAVLEAKSQILISNTFHLHLRPGEEVIKKAGGLHKFMGWDRPLMTDSGGFQVFSLGFGKDFGLGKFLDGQSRKNKKIKKSSQPKSVKITEDGVRFKSPIDGRELFLGPRESIKIQEKLGADIIFAFDECTPPSADYEYVKASLAKTHRWAKECLRAKKGKQSLFGIVQGSEFKDLREESAKYINSLDFDGFGIGGDLWRERGGTRKILRWIIPHLNEKKPRHLLGVGHLQNIEDIIKEGIDLFDCTVPTHYARRGIAFTSSGRLDLYKTRFLKDKKPVDQKCGCRTCRNYSRSYICHLFKAEEISAMSLLTFHNLYYFNTFIEAVRAKIKSGQI